MVQPPNYHSSLLDLVNPDVLLCSHHPVLHTAILGSLVQLGMLLGNENLGVFLYALFQFLFYIVTISFSLRILTHLKCPIIIRTLILAAYALIPVFSLYAVLVTKDALFGALLLLYLSLLASLPKTGATPRRTLVSIITAGILLSLMRNGGVVFALGSLLGHVFLLRESRKNLIACTACILVPALIVSNILFPALDITPGSKREILSIPFQQIARTVSQYPDDLTEEESSAIDTVLGIASLAERYDPNLSDRVKDGFNKHATVEDMASFWKAWLSLGLRHPAAYLSATANNYYGYFYLTDKDNEFYSLEWSKMCMESIPSFDFHQADNPAVRAFAWLNVSYDEIFNKVAPLSLFMSCPLYVWALILATLRAAYLKNRRLLALLISPWLIFLICLIGPANGISYFRYIFPVALSMPFLVGILFSPSGHDRRQLSRESHRSRPVASSF